MPHAIEEICDATAGAAPTFRFTTQDVAVGGTVIPAGAQVVVCWRGQPGPARYDDPDLDNAGRHQPPGLRPRHPPLPGARLARLEGQIALTTLHGRFPTMRLAVPRSALHWGHGERAGSRGLSELPFSARNANGHDVQG